MDLTILIAFLFDQIAGDPYWFPHPVRGIGKLIQATEFALRYLRVHERVAGIILTIFVIGITYIATFQIISYSHKLGNIFHIITGILIIYFTLSVRSLIKEAKKITSLLKLNDLHGARRELSNIVGRDTENLDRNQIMCACIESLAENMVDGIISPMFFAFVGGPPLAMAYKAVNTLDSMVGYKNKRYLRLGWASARLDDLANYIPARITLGLVPVASFFCGCKPTKSLKIGIRDGRKHPSPNSGISEALFAGALGVQLGGTSSYKGIVSHKPLIGETEDPLSLKKIYKTIQIIHISSLLMIILGLTVSVIISNISL